MSNLLQPNFPDHFNDAQPQRRLPAFMTHPNFWRRGVPAAVLVGVGALALCAAVTAPEHAAATPNCQVGVVAQTGHGRPQQVIMDAAAKAGLQEGPSNLVDAADHLYNVADGHVVHPGKAYTICFVGNVAQLDSIRETSRFAPSASSTP